MPYKDQTRQRQFQREWKARRRADFFAGKTCTWCGSAENLQLHHLDPAQKEDHRIWSWSEKRRADEIKKCIVLCQACHMDYHGTLSKPTTDEQASIDADSVRLMENLAVVFGNETG
jgi:hypothetical protein